MTLQLKEVTSLEILQQATNIILENPKTFDWSKVYALMNVYDKVWEREKYGRGIQ